MKLSSILLRIKDSRRVRGYDKYGDTDKKKN